MRNPSLDQLAERELALTVGCRYCGAKAGQGCITTDYSGRTHPLENLPAHPKRTKRAIRQQRMNAEANQ